MQLMVVTLTVMVMVIVTVATLYYPLEYPNKSFYSVEYTYLIEQQEITLLFQGHNYILC